MVERWTWAGCAPVPASRAAGRLRHWTGNAARRLPWPGSPCLPCAAGRHRARRPRPCTGWSPRSRSFRREW